MNMNIYWGFPLPMSSFVLKMGDVCISSLEANLGFKKKKGLLLSSFSPYWGWEEESDGPVKMKALLLAVGISYCKTWNFCLFV